MTTKSVRHIWLILLFAVSIALIGEETKAAQQKPKFTVEQENALKITVPTMVISARTQTLDRLVITAEADDFMQVCIERKATADEQKTRRTLTTSVGVSGVIFQCYTVQELRAGGAMTITTAGIGNWTLGK